MTQLRHLAVVVFAFGPIKIDLGLLQLLFEVANPFHRLAFALQREPEGVELFVEIGDLLLYFGAAFAAGSIGLLFQSFLLYL